MATQFCIKFETLLPVCRVGCPAGMGGGVREDPQQLLETAQFEEQQHNRAHAQELYERILRDHPGSPAAGEAEARLQEWKNENP